MLVELLASAPAAGLVRFALLALVFLVVGAEVASRRLFPSLAQADADVVPRALGRLVRAERVATALLAAVVLARLVQQASAFADTPGEWYRAAPLVVLRMTWGHAWLLQEFALVLVAATGVTSAGPVRAVRLAGIAGLVLAPALSGHAVGAPRLAMAAVAMDAAHVAAGGVWIGTLGATVLALAPERRTVPPAQIVALLGRFSPLALTSAAVLAGTGLFASWLHLETLPALWGTPYGRTLLLKGALTAAIAAAGAFNWRVATPRLATTGDTMPLARAVTLELGLALLLLLVTSSLIVTPLPAEG